MNRDQLAQLLVPFPPDQIEKLPKGGMQLDFVSHANVTARLLELDPDWYWEPFAVTAQGLPAFDEHGMLWIRLHLLDTVTIGVGEPQGSDVFDKTKGAIGNAIRNAAMRRGVALHLWQKTSKTAYAPKVLTQGKATEAQIKLIRSLLDKAGLTAAEARQAYLVDVLDHPLASLADLTGKDARLVIDALKTLEGEQA